SGAPASAAKLAFIQQPGEATAGNPINPAIQVAVEDAFGNAVATDRSRIGLSIASGPPKSSMHGAAAAATVNGVGTFCKGIFTPAGSYTLIATDGLLSSATSDTLTVNPALASKLLFARQPTNTVAGNAINPPVILEAQDRFKNIVTTDDSDMTISVISSPAGATIA